MVRHCLLSANGLSALASHLELNQFGVIYWGLSGLLDISGTARAEVGRLWIFLTPLALMAIFYRAGQGRLRIQHIHLLIGAQFLVCLLIGGNWLTP